MNIKIISMLAARMSLYFFSAGPIGLFLTSIFFIYTEESIAKIFFITASLFSVIALYGPRTKRDLSGLSSFLIMGVIGLVIASLGNIFFQNSALSNILSYIGVIIFTLLTAYDVEKLKAIYYQIGPNSNEIAQRISVYGALNLYMNFINLFMFLSKIFGARRN